MLQHLPQEENALLLRFYFLKDPWKKKKEKQRAANSRGCIGYSFSCKYPRYPHVSMQKQRQRYEEKYLAQECDEDRNFRLS